MRGFAAIQTGTGRPQRRGWTAAIVVACAMLLAPSAAFASWWNHDWSYRKQIVIDAGAKGADLRTDLDDVPVLIRLHEGVFKFSDANTDGTDLRFVADDDKTPLKYHIEKFDSVFNLAFVWVSVPKLKAGTVGNIWMYYGNTQAVGAGETRETYDPDQVLVYHFGERGTPAADATGYASNSRTIADVDENALIGTGAKFDGQNVVVVPSSPSLSIAAGGAMTWSVWIKPSAADEDAVLYSRRGGAGSLVIGLAKGAPYLSIGSEGGAVRQTPALQPLGDKGWHQVAMVATATENSLYVDGKPVAVLSTPLPALNAEATLGGADPGSPQPRSAGFIGELDELEISKVARAPAAIALAALNQGGNDRLVGYGQDEHLSTWSSGYLSIILRSVTFDGWVIIVILLVMAGLSWSVMITKAGRIQRVGRANKTFLELFRSVRGDFSALNHLAAGSASSAGAEFPENKRQLVQQAPLFHMFSAGVDELRQRLAGDHPGSKESAYLTPQSIEAIRASLDSSLVQESQQLNKSMVMLTIAISGGPFIGLLGTVVGVMTTFAAIAASGDVNVNSIAPGIAAALVATVAGLIVAIPALFGYNYLITRIKDITAEMQVFLDAFVTRMAENYNAPPALRAMAAQE